MITLDLLEAILWLGVPGVGSQTLKKLHFFVHHRGMSWGESWEMLTLLKERAILNERQFEQAKSYRTTKWSAAYLEARLVEADISVVGKGSPLYPARLAETDNAPYLLFYQGNGALLRALATQPSVAVVGTRKITPYGVLVTQNIVAELVAEDTIIISGGMYGVDAAAHAAALTSGGATIAVLGSGLAKIGSYWQQALSQQIIEGGGLLLSEFFPWSASQKAHFPIRNRVVAGLSQAVVVTEAAQRSGSLITAQWALDYGREVCAVPGPITSQFSTGTRWLINQGATLVATGREVLATFDPSYSVGAPELVTSKSEATTPLIVPAAKLDSASQLCQLLKQTGSSTTAQLANQLHLPLTATLALLSKLELDGRILSIANTWYLAS